MKDYDDLLRLASENRALDWEIVGSLLADRAIPLTVLTEWNNDETNSAWKRPIRRYKDIPTELATVFTEINRWIRKGD